MFTKKFLSLLLAAGLAFGFSLNAGAVADVNQFKEMFGLTGCVCLINNSLKTIPEEVKSSNEKVFIFCEKFNEYQEQVVSKKKTLTPAQMEKQKKELTKRFEDIYIHDKDFRMAFIKAVGGKSHASIQGGINSRLSNRRINRWTQSFYDIL